MNNFVSSDCEAWYMLTECLCLANALSDLNILYTSSLVWENMTVFGNYGGLICTSHQTCYLVGGALIALVVGWWGTCWSPWVVGGPLLSP